MDELKNKPVDTNEPAQTLADESRIKVLSPGMMVFKRFIRNRLAIVGLVILVLMFAFSFLGGIFSPYSQKDVFFKYEITKKDFATATHNTELRYYYNEASGFNNSARSAMQLALARGETGFEYGGIVYTIGKDGQDFYRVYNSHPAVTIRRMRVFDDLRPVEGSDFVITDAIRAQVTEALNSGITSLEIDGVEYALLPIDEQNYVLGQPETIAVASMLSFDAWNEADIELINTPDFRYEAERAHQAGEAGFTLDDVEYVFAEDDGYTLVQKGGENFAMMSSIIVSPIDNSIFLEPELKIAVREAIIAKQESFELAGESGEMLDYEVQRVNAVYYIKGDAETMLIDMYGAPSKAHPLGTDANGMDLLTRLMYGGRISLMVGFVVVFLELLIGVLFGGISGYFGGFVDTVMMRFVDLFNCIPYYPMMIIVGSLLDAYKVPSEFRIWLLMILLGVMGWTSIARTVRGQILSLREQDFMIATEATGIRVGHRIFRHLVPNVMPLLIVSATMSLGGIIISEATLSFLGLGVKFPLASWGNIINQASDLIVMTNYLFIWLPAGMLILLTVLGFNFVGDGLRDAFDPKMKR